TYTATISTAAKDLAGNALAFDMSWSFTTGVIPDTTAPTVSATVPANATTSVDRKTTRPNTSHEPISDSAINTSTFTLKQSTTPVSVIVSYSGLPALHSFPTRRSSDLTYTATISTAAKDLAGNALAFDMSWSFTTGVIPDTTAPTVSAMVPANATTS